MASDKFINPFEVSLADFIKAVDSSKKTVKEYCKGSLTDKEIESLETEINHYNLKTK